MRSAPHAPRRSFEVVLFSLLAVLLLGSTGYPLPPEVQGFWGDPVALGKKDSKKVVKLGKLLDKNEAKLLLAQEKLAAAEAARFAAEDALAVAEALPDATPAEAAVKAKALKAAKTGLKKAKKDVAKWEQQRAGKEAKVLQLALKTIALDPAQLFGFAAEAKGLTPYDPPWGLVEPLQVLSLEWDAKQTPAENGQRLKQAAQALQPGQRLEVGAGTWVVDSYFQWSRVGTPSAPIWMVAKEGTTPVLTRSDAGQNVLNIGGSAPGSAAYVCLRGFEIAGGSAGVRIYGGSNVWLDRCEIHHTGDAALTANTVNTDHLYITRNHIHHTSGYGEGMYLGGNGGSVVMRDSVIARNYVHDTRGSQQGDGIEVKQGSYGNWIVENCIHDTRYPAILVYGTSGKPINVIERNVCFHVDDNVMQVQGEALVMNNLLIDGARAFYSGDHQGQTRDLAVIHNTIVNTGTAAQLASWNGRPGMYFANNAVYSNSGGALSFSGGSAGVQAAGNVVYGGVYNVPAGGYQPGKGITDFLHVAFDGSFLLALPAVGSPLVKAGSSAYAASFDVTGAVRASPPTAGCAEPR